MNTLELELTLKSGESFSSMDESFREFLSHQPGMTIQSTQNIPAMGLGLDEAIILYVITVAANVASAELSLRLRKFFDGRKD